MYFKKLELFGFKSFGEKTEIIFEPGVTAIVGPNGCGKSNISDAIQWVLGEQSPSEMRSKQMQDLIFNGAQDREPVNLAEVSLTLVNDDKILGVDYEEVTLTRRLFRSGESEYLLNKVPVRLKDISELLMGTGLGTSTYSMIGQGRIDQVVSLRPEERRQVFEEASGITKYKARRAECLRKLEQTEANLLRINDIILEVKRQTASIERQVNKARSYKEVFDRLKELETKIAKWEFNQIHTQNLTEEKRLGELQLWQSAWQTKIDTWVLKIGLLREIIEKIFSELEEARGKERELQSQLEKSQHRYALNVERSEELQARENSSRGEISQAEKKIQELKTLIEKNNQRFKELHEEIEVKKALLAQKENECLVLMEETKKTQNTINQAKADLLEVVSQEAKVKSELTKITTESANLTARCKRLELDKSKTAQELADLGAKIEAVEKEIFILEENKQQVSEKEALQAEGLKNREENIAKMKEEEASLKNYLTALRSRYQFLEELTQHYEGFPEAVKVILQEVEAKTCEISGIYGALANLLEVEEGYELSVEIALGELAAGLVVENQQTAQRAIEYINERNLGRADFLCLDDIAFQNRPSNEKLHPLADFVSTDAKIMPLVKFFLKDTFLVEDANTAGEYLAKDKTLRLVTKSGFFFSQAFCSGGNWPADLDAHLIGRQTRLKFTKEEIDKLDDKIQVQQEKVLAEAKLADEEKLIIGQTQQEIHRLEIEISNRNTVKEKLAADQKKISEELSLLELELAETDELLQEKSAAEEKYRTQLQHLEENNRNVQGLINQGQQLISENSTHRQENLISQADLKAALSGIEREEEYLLGTQDGVLDQQEEENKSILEKEKEIAESIEKRKALQEENLAIEKQKEAWANERNMNTAAFAQIQQRYNRMTHLVQQLEAEMHRDQKELDLLRQNLHELEVRQTERSYHLQNIKDRVWQNYKVELKLEEICAQAAITLDGQEKNQAESLRNKLESLGPVNLIAIEEHQELQERYDFLTHQHEDLIQAKESLHKAIQEINKTTHVLFEETFQKIQQEFRQFFRLLFGGGEADLVLLDEQNILDSGIEIVARPPGKKMQNISLFSGGEKAMIAISLLFAIFKVKPSPFCVLDEIDAPLDESNVGRFSKVLEDFVKQSQFIIITHNKKTIAMADCMYGITMEKRGLSKIVSVKFKESKGKEEKAQPAEVLT
jgi:chromosome segregation protein